MTTYQGYRCPLCQRQMPRDLIAFLDHSHEHVVDQIKTTHPDWVESDGACKECVAYYERAMSGQSAEENIGPAGQRKRRIMGVFSLAVALLFAILMIRTEALRIARAFLFLPLFSGLLGWFQAEKKTCVILSELGTCHLDSSPRKIDDDAIRQALKLRGRKILLQALVISSVVTLLFLLAP